MDSACSQTQRPSPAFSDAYGALLAAPPARAGHAEEAAPPATLTEQHLQVAWYEQSFNAATLRTEEGHTLEVVSPGWWNQQAGPDFRGAQLVFNGSLFNGDVEIHLSVDGWQAHRHHRDARYDSVILHVVLDAPRQERSVETVSGRRIPLLVLRPYLDPLWPGDALEEEDTGLAHGACSTLLPRQGEQPLLKALELASEWRLLSRARTFADRMARAGGNQAVYEAMMYAAGFSAFKYHFQEIARQLPYDRAVQLAQHDPLLLEATLLQIAGLLPDGLDPDASAVPHLTRLQVLRREHLPGLRPLPLEWKRVALRPANYPERRLAGMARMVARTDREGLLESIMQVWRSRESPKETQAAFEKMFPTAMGFWANHYTWTGKHLAQAAAPLGAARIRSIIGNVFLPVGLAVARELRDRELEEHLLAHFLWMPGESLNHIIERMIPKLMGDSGLKLRNKFYLQQGMLQFYQDWCGPNPSCRNCSMHRYLDQSHLQD